MARPVLCDPHQGQHNADVMLTDFSDGTTIGLCRDAFLAVCLAVIEQAAEAEATETAEIAEARLANASPPARGRSRQKSAEEVAPEESSENADVTPAEIEDGDA